MVTTCVLSGGGESRRSLWPGRGQVSISIRSTSLSFLQDYYFCEANMCDNPDAAGAQISMPRQYTQNVEVIALITSWVLCRTAEVRSIEDVHEMQGNPRKRRDSTCSLLSVRPFHAFTCDISIEHIVSPRSRCPGGAFCCSRR